MLLVSGVLLSCAQGAFAWSYHSFAYGYSITLPDDWTQVAEEVLAADYTKLPKISSSQGRRDVAFQAKRGNALDYPFILVEVQQYSQMGFAHQVNDREIHQIVKTSTGLDPSNPYLPDRQVMEGGAEVEPMDGVLKFDAENRRFTWNSAGTLADAGLIRTQQWGLFGKDILVRVTLFERGKGSGNLRDMARSAAGTLKFEIGREYQPAFTIWDAVKMAGQMAAAPNIGVLVTFLCVGTAMVFALIALMTNRRQQASYEQYSVFDRER